ncbi:unnamed protein product [Miscanthus lutarioriparius]|uniref:Uncharacterized protein n=1 Tax=Miscanthus lutarioriparius TaxID=422564 RepID=A0A811PN22_9POAL|nr:unnamed protein product [Miscanthus lutarioriparius]
MPEVSFCMEYAKKKIKDIFPTSRKADLLKQILAIIDRRWEDQMDQPLYGAALYLNPNKYFDLKTDDALAGKLRSAFTEVLAKMVPDQDLQNKIDDQALDYEEGVASAKKLQSTTSKPSLLVVSAVGAHLS